jgi:hypothetical protein
MRPEAEEVRTTQTFDEDCQCHDFPDDEVDDVKALILDDRECGHIVCVARPNGGAIRCAELRILPWLYERQGTRTCAVILYLNVRETRPLLLRLQVDNVREVVLPDPEKLSRWLQIMFEYLDVLSKTIG